MASPSPSTTVAERFFAPLDHLLSTALHSRSCPALPDSAWLRLLVCRVLHEVPSGRAFLQQYAHLLPATPATGAFFESIKSTRRLSLLSEINAGLQGLAARMGCDPFTHFPHLNDFDVFAGDGHFHAAAVHDEIVGGIRHATGHFYGLNLRHQGVIHLTTGDRTTRLREHDMRALKRLDSNTLRQGAPKGRRVLWVWDKAGIDFRQWHCWKQSAGIYFISRAKEGQADEVMGESAWDTKASINQGIVSDQLVGTSNGVLIRRVTYRDPVDGEILVFLTNEMGLPPGLIAHLYRMRWDIEKTFDEFKNKLGEKKSWASSPTAKTIQAQCLCLAHTLLMLFEKLVLETAGIRNEAEEARRTRRLEQLEKQLKNAGEVMPEALRHLSRCTQHSVKLIRWLRSCLFVPTSCEASLGRLRALYRKS